MIDIIAAVEEINAEIAKFRRKLDQAVSAANELKKRISNQESAYDKIQTQKAEIANELENSLTRGEHIKAAFLNSSALQRAVAEMQSETGDILARQETRLTEILSSCYKQYQDSEHQHENAEQNVRYFNGVIKELKDKLFSLTGGV